MSVQALNRAFKESDTGASEYEVDENGCLRIHMHGKTFLVAVIGKNQIRFFVASAETPEGTARAELISVANEFNADLGFVSGAYVSDEDGLVYTRAFSVSGGVSPWNVVQSLHEFALDHAVFEQLLVKRFSGRSA